MAKPQINTGAYGDRRSSAAGEGAKEAFKGAEGDFDKGTERGQTRREHESKLATAKEKRETANLQQEQLRTNIADKERTYRKEYTIDQATLAQQTAQVQTDFKNIRGELFPLLAKRKKGELTTKENERVLMLESSIETFKGIHEANRVGKEKYNKVLDAGGPDDLDDPLDRAKALAWANNTLQLTNKDGEWFYQGDVEGPDGTITKVDEPAVNFLDNLNLTERTDWETTDADIVANLELRKTRVTTANGGQYDSYTYDESKLLAAATKSLSTPDQLDSYAFRYLTTVKGLTDEEARQQVKDYGLDGYGKFKTELIDHHAAELINQANARSENVHVKSGAPEFSKENIATFTNRIASVKEAFATKDLATISAGVNGLNGAFESSVVDGKLVVTQYNPVTGKATSQKTFGPNQLTEARKLVNNNLLGEKGVYFQSTLPPEVEAKVIPLEDKYGAPTGPTPNAPLVAGRIAQDVPGPDGPAATEPAVALEDPATSTNPKRAKKQFQQKYGITYSNHQKLNNLTDTQKTKMQTLSTEYKGLTASLEGVGRESTRGKQIIARRNELKEEASTLTGLGFSGYGFSGDGAFSTIDKYNKAGEIEAYGAPKETGPTPQAQAKTAIETFKKDSGVSFDVKTNKKLSKVLQALGNDWLENIPTDLQTTVAAQKKIIEDAYNNLNK